jgi:hypothetical protein
MTTLHGLVGNGFNLLAIVASALLSSQRAVLIHQFDDSHRIVQPASRIAIQRWSGIIESVRTCRLEAERRKRSHRMSLTH